MIKWMKTKGINIRNNDVIDKVVEGDEEKTISNFSNFMNE